MTNKLVVIINSLKVPKIKKILLYEMKFLVPNYGCLQNPWLVGYRLPDPLSLSPLSSTEFVEPPSARTKFLDTPLALKTWPATKPRDLLFSLTFNCDDFCCGRWCHTEHVLFTCLRLLQSKRNMFLEGDAPGKHWDLTPGVWRPEQKSDHYLTSEC